jgi:hypothetical protein
MLSWRDTRYDKVRLADYDSLPCSVAAIGSSARILPDAHYIALQAQAHAMRAC